MANAKKLRRQQRALERLEARIEIDGLGLARQPGVSGNTWEENREHYNLREALGLNPKLAPRPHPADWYRFK